MFTRGWNTAINVRQFAFPVKGFTWPEHYRYPDVTYDNRMTFRSGALTFELHHARGETDDATWTWIPEKKLLAPGDLFIWAASNAGNPQKVQRFAGEWATALRKMCALGADTMIPGHGLPIFGADRIREALTDTADLLDSLESQVLALMNAGAPLDRVLHEVRMPEHLLHDHAGPAFVLASVFPHGDAVLFRDRAEVFAEGRLQDRDGLFAGDVLGRGVACGPCIHPGRLRAILPQRQLWCRGSVREVR